MAYRIIEGGAAIQCDTPEEAIEVARAIKASAERDGRKARITRSCPAPHSARCPKCWRSVQGWRTRSCKCGSELVWREDKWEVRP